MKGTARAVVCSFSIVLFVPSTLAAEPNQGFWGGIGGAFSRMGDDLADVFTGKGEKGKYDADNASGVPAGVPAEPMPEGRNLVKEIQYRLTAMGYSPGPVDGVLGNRTSLAIREFQINSGIVVDGAPSQQVLAVMRSASRSVHMPGTGGSTTEASAASSFGSNVAQVAGNLLNAFGSNGGGGSTDALAKAALLGVVNNAGSNSLPSHPNPAIGSMASNLARGVSGSQLSGSKEELAISAITGSFNSGSVGTSNIPSADQILTAVNALPATGAGKPQARHTGGAVSEIQQGLAALGYSVGPIDGVMGKETQLAIYQYQKAVGLPIDGQPSDQLLGSIRAQTGRTLPAPTRTLTRQEVVEVQRHLDQMGFAPGDSDGAIDSRFEAAIYAYQREFGLTPADGQPSVTLLSSLRSNNSAASGPGPSNLPPIRVPMASNLRRAEKTLYYECEKELNAERRQEGLPEIRLITQQQAQADAKKQQQQMVADAMRHHMTQGGTAGMGVPQGKSYLDAMVDQSDMLLGQQMARGNARMQEFSDVQKEQERITAAQVEIARCVSEKAR